MRGLDETSGSLFSYVDLEARIPARHPLRRIRQVVNGALASLDAEFEALYTDFGRPSISPERLIRASLLQILFSVRSERQLMEQMQYNLLFRWFAGLGIDDPVWVTAPSRKVPSNQPILRRNIADPRAGLKALGHNPRLEVVRPTPTPRGAIKDLDPRHSPRPAHLHLVLVLVLHSQPPANSVAG